MTGSVFREAELRYLGGGRQLGRIATVGADGTPHVVPVAWIYNAARDTIDIGGHELGKTKKFRDVERSGRAAIAPSRTSTSAGSSRPQRRQPRSRTSGSRSPCDGWLT